MDLPELSRLSIEDGPVLSAPDPPDRYLLKYKEYVRSLPYEIEPESKMVEMLDFIVMRIQQCCLARDYDVGFLQFDSMLGYWMMLKYPIPKSTRIMLAKLYFHLSTTPGMPNAVMATCADGFKTLTESEKKLSIADFR
jgi:proteasome activator subunit 4